MIGLKNIPIVTGVQVLTIVVWLVLLCFDTLSWLLPTIVVGVTISFVIKWYLGMITFDQLRQLLRDRYE